MTGDTTGDVCNHARSKFIQLISKVTLKQFMDNFNSLATEEPTSGSSCIYGGCDFTGAFNYNPSATFNDGSCIARRRGCMDSLATNFQTTYNTPCASAATSRSSVR